MDFKVQGIPVSWEDMRPDNEEVSYRDKQLFAQATLSEGVRHMCGCFFNHEWARVPPAARQTARFCEYTERLADFFGEKGIADEPLRLLTRVVRGCVADFDPVQRGDDAEEVFYLFALNPAALYGHEKAQQVRQRIENVAVPRILGRYGGRDVLSLPPSHAIVGQGAVVLLTDFPRTQHGVDYLVNCGRVASASQDCSFYLEGDFLESDVAPCAGFRTTGREFLDYRKFAGR